jgi:PPOX class probable F420-dependent enzyme
VPKQRDRVRMSDAEAAEMLAAGRKVQLATINPDGYPHLVTMYYTLVDGKIAFWTYRTSQKALNLARDPRISCLVETGEAYFDLRGVQIQGTVEAITDPDAVYQIGLRIGHVMGSALAGAGAAVSNDAEGAVNEYVASAARKRNGYLVNPVRVISWDHTKLAVPPGQVT